MRPDMRRTKELRTNATPIKMSTAVQYKDKYVIQIMQVGYGPDTRWKETLEKKRHPHLKAKLRAAG